MLDIALEIPLGFLPFSRSCQRDYAYNARVERFCDAFDHTALAGSVPPFEQNHHPQAFFFNPTLHLHQFHLQLSQLFFVNFVGNLRFFGARRCAQPSAGVHFFFHVLFVV